MAHPSPDPRPRLSSAYYKAHGLGNDYLVFEAHRGVEEQDLGWQATPENVRRVCHRHSGVGSDGIVVLLDPGEPGREARSLRVGLRMFNPDGGEFERSGNGLRVLASYLARGDADLASVIAEVGGDDVPMTVHGREGAIHDVSVEMGRATVSPDAVEMSGPIDTGPDGAPLDPVPVSVGNPHLVVLDDAGLGAGEAEARLATIGPYLATHPALAHGANVQLARPDGAEHCRAFIWERGVGRTSASGTSACAVAVAMVSTGRLDPGVITVTMPGGALAVTVSADLDVILRGPVEEVGEGRLSPDFVRGLGQSDGG